MLRQFTASLLLSGFSLLLSIAPRAAGADPKYESAEAKLDQLLDGNLAPGSQVLFTPEEIDAWVAVKAKEKVGEGLRDPHVKLQNGAGSGAALVDFLKIREEHGKTTNALMARLLEGERLLKVFLRVSSYGGRCTVFLTSVELSGSTISGSVLDYLIKTFLLPLYPDVKLGEPIDLPLNMDRIDLTPEGVRVTMKK